MHVLMVCCHPEWDSFSDAILGRFLAGGPRETHTKPPTCTGKDSIPS